MHLLFHRHRCPVENDTVKALFAENLQAHERAGRATEEVTRVAEDSRRDLEGVREDIARRTNATRNSRPEPHTSDVRQLCEDVLNRPGLRGPSDRDPS